MNELKFVLFNLSLVSTILYITVFPKVYAIAIRAVKIIRGLMRYVIQMQPEQNKRMLAKGVTTRVIITRESYWNY